MNCQDFQEQWFEYLDGSLPTRTHQAIEQHLAACPACRQDLVQHQQLAKKISGQLFQSVKSLALDKTVRSRVLASLQTQPAPVRGEKFPGSLWRPFAWATGLACLLVASLILSNYFHGTRQERSGSETRLAAAPMPVSIRVARVETTYTSCVQGGFVTDALVCRTNFVNQTLWANASSKPVPKGFLNKMSL